MRSGPRRSPRLYDKSKLGSPRVFGELGELDESQELVVAPPDLPGQEEEVRGAQGLEPDQAVRRGGHDVPDPKRGQDFKAREEDYRKTIEEKKKTKRAEKDKREQERLGRQARRDQRKADGRMHGLLPDLQ